MNLSIVAETEAERGREKGGEGMGGTVRTDKEMMSPLLIRQSEVSGRNTW